MGETELFVNKPNRNKPRNIILSSLLLIFVFLLTFLMESVVLPKFIFPRESIPEFVNSKLENRIIVIFFLSILLMTIGRKYFYLFKTDALKKKESYVWIFIILIIVDLMMGVTSGFNAMKFSLLPLGFIPYLIQLFRVVILVPIQEELLYRGLLILVPSQKIKYFMLGVSSIIFALLHDDPFKLFWLGLGLGVLAIKFKNIWIPIIAHAIWNLVVSFFIL